jgi:hypothetical protein
VSASDNRNNHLGIRFVESQLFYAVWTMEDGPRARTSVPCRPRIHFSTRGQRAPQSAPDPSSGVSGVKTLRTAGQPDICRHDRQQISAPYLHQCISRRLGVYKIPQSPFCPPLALQTPTSLGQRTARSSPAGPRDRWWVPFPPAMLSWPSF